MLKLGVNIDHVATIREARGTFEPDPVTAARESERAGADGIVCHLRKDRRHIKDEDLEKLKKTVTTRLNLEMSMDPEICEIACGIKPDQATLVPEKRQEITTEGGLDVVSNLKRLEEVVKRLSGAGIKVSLFIDPEKEQIEAAKDLGVEIIELHTGRYAVEFERGGFHEKELKNLEAMIRFAMKKKLTVCAGHGLTYDNVAPVARIDGLYELNIGHTIVSKSVFVGIYEAVKQMKQLIE